MAPMIHYKHFVRNKQIGQNWQQSLQKQAMIANNKIWVSTLLYIFDFNIYKQQYNTCTLITIQKY